MHELVAVAAVAEHEDVRAVGHPLEEDAEDAQPAVPEDRARPNDGDIEPLAHGIEARPLGGEFGMTVRLDRGGHGGGQDRVAAGHAEHGAGRRVHHLAHTRSRARRQQQRGAVDVDRAQQLLVLGQRNLRHVVEHDVDAMNGVGYYAGVADVALHQFHPGWPVVNIVEVEHSHGVAGRDKAVHQQRSEVAATTGDERDRHSSSPWPRHQRMLRRIPSYSSTFGT